jgi:hypothetical protein
MTNSSVWGKLYHLCISVIIFFVLSGCSKSTKLSDGGLRIGWAIEDITPKNPISLMGQFYPRISQYVQSPLKVTALAIESANEDGKKEQAIMISVDILHFKSGGLQDSVRILVKNQLPDFNVEYLILNATHTHTSFDPSSGGEHRKMLMDKLCKVAVAAWRNRKPGGISSELRYAVVGHNRRVEYADGSTEMYGACERNDFAGLEGPEDSAVKIIFCWDLNCKLTGIIMNVACPAQVMEGKYCISSDYWGELRKQLLKKFPGILILTQIGAAGDISPRDLPRGYKAGEPNMWDVSGMEEIGKRLMNTIEDAYTDALNSVKTKVVFKHVVKNIEILSRIYSKEDYQRASDIIQKIKSREPKDLNASETVWNRFLSEKKANELSKENGPWDNKLSDYGILKMQEALVKQYEVQEQHLLYPAELHIIRLGDSVIATNPFELFVDYGFRIESRSHANKTFLVELCGGDYGGYLPTQKAIEGKGYRGYSALVNNVGFAGGQILVDETVKTINELFGLSAK